MGYSHIQSLMRAGCWNLQRNEELWIGGDSKGKETQRSVSSRERNVSRRENRSRWRCRRVPATGPRGQRAEGVTLATGLLWSAGVRPRSRGAGGRVGSRRGVQPVRRAEKGGGTYERWSQRRFERSRW